MAINQIGRIRPRNTRESSGSEGLGAFWQKGCLGFGIGSLRRLPNYQDEHWLNLSQNQDLKPCATAVQTHSAPRPNVYLKKNTKCYSKLSTSFR